LANEIGFNFEKTGAAYLAAEGFLEQLKNELDGITAIHENLILTDRPVQQTFWSQNIWKAPTLIPIESIKDGARKLKSIQRNWKLYSYQLHRRAKLIEENLPHVTTNLIEFPNSKVHTSLGSWTLLTFNTILASADCSSLFPNGEVCFIEDKVGPPNRAYLKLQEALTVIGDSPQTGEFCLDIGGSPGGWAWVLQKLGAQVLSIDRSPLDSKIAKLPGVDFLKKDAFAIKPSTISDYCDSKKVDWLCWDVICFPEKLLDWLTLWIEPGICKNFIVTIKFQGESHYEILECFSKIPGSKLVHLYHNKHELTWILTRGSD
jgi:23S rRNA (cytidine2498-2'-O)-methyltransferase